MNGKPTPLDIVKAHQYLYYVLSEPVLSDRNYDLFCSANGIDGNGGSDCARHYSKRVIALAMKLKDTPNGWLKDNPNP